MIRLGVDFGGTKIEAAALDRDGRFLARMRRPNPGAYPSAIATVRDLVAEVEQAVGVKAERIGVGMPGSLSPKDGAVRNANSTWLNGRPFDRDLSESLARPVRVANDANCFTLSEATDGAAEGKRVVFGVIIGTGCGGGVVVDGRLHSGPNGLSGEWGHAPLPWPTAEERGAHRCWCGRTDCLETWISGPAFAADHRASTGHDLSAADVAGRADGGEPSAVAALQRYADRLARALAMVCDIFDPDAIVLGGGMSNVSALYDLVPTKVAERVFSDVFATPIVPARFGDSSGVRGAAWLWPWD